MAIIIYTLLFAKNCKRHHNSIDSLISSYLFEITILMILMNSIEKIIK
jgi:hypothetical protein